MNTKTKIIELARELIQEKGSNAFSYQDIAEALAIKKASIHYYFPHKNDLLRELVQYYSAQLESFLQSLDKKKSAKEKLKAFFALYTDMSKSGTKLCLCGILAAEIMTLAEDLRASVVDFFEIQEKWLSKIYGSNKKAKTVLASLQGAMLISRATADSGFIKQVLRDLSL